jgi:hypothetical protein
MSEGELLTGDGVIQGIVRIGDTVRRPLRPFSLTVQAYLAHLRDAGFTAAPLPFGVDEQGREMLLGGRRQGRAAARRGVAARVGRSDHRLPRPAGLGGRSSSRWRATALRVDPAAARH